MPAGRASAEVEFLRTLKRLMDVNQREFAKACGKTQANISAYLSGFRQPGERVLRSCLEHIFEWAVEALLEIEPIPENLSELPTDPGIYIFYDSAGNVLYIGKAGNFRTEIRQTLGRRLPVPLRFGPKLKKTSPKFSD